MVELIYGVQCEQKMIIYKPHEVIRVRKGELVMFKKNNGLGLHFLGVYEGSQVYKASFRYPESNYFSNPILILRDPSIHEGPTETPVSRSMDYGVSTLVSPVIGLPNIREELDAVPSLSCHLGWISKLDKRDYTRGLIAAFREHGPAVKRKAPMAA